MATNGLKKRGRPRIYASTDEKRAADVEKRRAQRRIKAAGAREVQFEQYYLGGLGQIGPLLPALTHRTQPVSGEPCTAAAQTCNGSRPDESNDLGEFLPPLSPLGSPSLDPIPTGIDGAPDLSIVDSGTLEGPDEEERGDIATMSDRIGAIYKDEGGIAGATALDTQAEEVGKLADQLTDQLIRHQGCCEHCHQLLQEEHAENHPNHVGLQDYLDTIARVVDCQDVLGSKTMRTHGSNLASQINGASRRHLYCGVGKDDLSPVHICMKADDRATLATEVTFDIDSVLGFASSLAVAK